MTNVVEPLMSKSELAAYLKIHEKTVEDHVKKGLPVLRVGGVFRFRLSDVLSWYENQQQADEPVAAEA
jgi:excisionase family DNA binding protein